MTSAYDQWHPTREEAEAMARMIARIPQQNGLLLVDPEFHRMYVEVLTAPWWKKILWKITWGRWPR